MSKWQVLIERVIVHSLFLLLTFLFSYSAMAADPVFRKPFTLHLPIDQEHYYEEQFGPIPYVHEGSVYLFKGDKFGINFDWKEGEITGVRYSPSLENAELSFEFDQHFSKDGNQMMMLKITNHTKKTIHMDALMTVPGKKAIFKTSILPVQAGFSGYESWPHPIVQLVLREFSTQP